MDSQKLALMRQNLAFLVPAGRNGMNWVFNPENYRNGTRNLPITGLVHSFN